MGDSCLELGLQAIAAGECGRGVAGGTPDKIESLLALGETGDMGSAELAEGNGALFEALDRVPQSTAMSVVAHASDGESGIAVSLRHRFFEKVARIRDSREGGLELDDASTKGQIATRLRRLTLFALEKVEASQRHERPMDWHGGRD